MLIHITHMFQASQALESEHESVVMRLYKFRNINASSIRTIMIARCHDNKYSSSSASSSSHNQSKDSSESRKRKKLEGSGGIEGVDTSHTDCSWGKSSRHGHKLSQKMQLYTDGDRGMRLLEVDSDSNGSNATIEYNMDYRLAECQGEREEELALGIDGESEEEGLEGVDGREEMEGREGSRRRWESGELGEVRRRLSGDRRTDWRKLPSSSSARTWGSQHWSREEIGESSSSGLQLQVPSDLQEEDWDQGGLTSDELMEAETETSEVESIEDMGCALNEPSALAVPNDPTLSDPAVSRSPTGIIDSEAAAEQLHGQKDFGKSEPAALAVMQPQVPLSKSDSCLEASSKVGLLDPDFISDTSSGPSNYGSTLNLPSSSEEAKLQSSPESSQKHKDFGASLGACASTSIKPLTAGDRYLIFTTGLKTYTPHQIGIKKIQSLEAARKMDLTTSNDGVRILPNMDNDNNGGNGNGAGGPEMYDTVDHLIELHGHIIGMCLSPDHR